MNDGHIGRGAGQKKIRTFQDLYMATVTGDIEDVNGVLKIVRINVHYNLKLPADKRTDAEEAFNNYITLCSAAQSVVEAIKITHKLEMTDEYFSVVDIDDSKVTITSYSGNTGDYSLFDTTIATILANNQSQSIDITDNTPLSVTAALDPGNLSGQNADWWVVANAPSGNYSLTPSGWSAGINMLAQYPLLKMGPEEVFKGYLPVGDYTFYFGVDMSPDGILNNPLYYDGVQVQVTLDTTEHDNWVFLTPVPGNPPLAFGLADRSITSGQPWGGVSTGVQDQLWGINVKAGRHASSSVASWFHSHASAATCANWPSGCPVLAVRSELRLHGELTINGTGYPVTIGQGSVWPHNNWWIGGPGWTMHSTILDDAVVTPDGKYFFEPADDTFNQFWIRTSY